MNRFIKIYSLFCMMFALSFSLAYADEVTDRETLNQQVQNLYFAQDYKQLDQIYLKALNNQSRTSSGIWILRQYYESFLKIFQSIEADDSNTWEAQETLLKNWIKVSPTSAAPKILYAKLLEKHAWAYRSEEYSSLVTPEGWKGFKKLNKENQIYLNSIKQNTLQDPEWYVTALDNASFTGIDKKNYTLLFNEATNKHPSYYTLYFNAINHRYLPKWGGSKGEMEKLARLAVQKTHAMEGDALYSRIYWVISADLHIKNLNNDTDVDWQYMKKSMDQVLAKYPDPWNYVAFALIACQQRDQAQTNKLFKSISNFNPKNWDKDSGLDSYNYCKSFGNNSLESYQKALNDYQNKKMDEHYDRINNASESFSPEFYEKVNQQLDKDFPPYVVK